MFMGFPWPGGTTILFYLAGLMKIPHEIIDASKVDGVNGWKLFWHIELPLVMGQVKLFLILTIIGNIQGFAGPLIMTQGGPGFATMVPGLHMFYAATQRQQYGYASAIGTVHLCDDSGLLHISTSSMFARRSTLPHRIGERRL